jgi:hypothetical protein
VLGVAIPVLMTVVQFEYLGAVLTIVFSGFPGTRPIAVLLSRNGRL